VQGDQGVVDEALEEFLEQVDVEAAHGGAGVRHVHLQAGRPEKSMTTRDSASSSGT
jgi:hypothetical protein